MRVFSILSPDWSFSPLVEVTAGSDVFTQLICPALHFFLPLFKPSCPPLYFSIHPSSISVSAVVAPCDLRLKKPALPQTVEWWSKTLKAALINKLVKPKLSRGLLHVLCIHEDYNYINKGTLCCFWSLVVLWINAKEMSASKHGCLNYSFLETS